MKDLWIILTAVCLLAFGSLTFANSVTIDPSLPGSTTLTVTCEYPIQREDGSDLTINEIAKVSFFVEKDGTGGYLPAGENTTACKQVYDMSQVPDGVYVYSVTTVDTEGRESQFSTETVIATVKRLPNPRSPTEVLGSVS